MSREKKRTDGKDNTIYYDLDGNEFLEQKTISFSNTYTPNKMTYYTIKSNKEKEEKGQNLRAKYNKALSNCIDSMYEHPEQKLKDNKDYASIIDIVNSNAQDTSMLLYLPSKDNRKFILRSLSDLSNGINNLYRQFLPYTQDIDSTFSSSKKIFKVLMKKEIKSMIASIRIAVPEYYYSGVHDYDGGSYTDSICNSLEFKNLEYDPSKNYLHQLKEAHPDKKKLKKEARMNKNHYVRYMNFQPFFMDFQVFAIALCVILLVENLLLASGLFTMGKPYGTHLIPALMPQIQSLFVIGSVFISGRFNKLYRDSDSFVGAINKLSSLEQNSLYISVAMFMMGCVNGIGIIFSSTPSLYVNIAFIIQLASLALLIVVNVKVTKMSKSNK